MNRLKKLLNNIYVGGLIAVAVLVLSVAALSSGNTFVHEHTLVIFALLILIIVISGAV